MKHGPLGPFRSQGPQLQAEVSWHSADCSAADQVDTYLAIEELVCCHDRLPLSQCACLVEHHCLDAMGPLQSISALHKAGKILSRAT